MKINAYAKINLTLDITGKREDGYHLLDTVMQSVCLFDVITLEAEKEPGVRLFSNREYLPTNEKNTAYKAAKAFFEFCGIEDKGISITIEKRIPSRAGMGGGSADAAAVLRGMNAMFKTELSDSQLCSLGAGIGADVPFCLFGGTARCTGIGEILEPTAPMPDCFLVICKPPAGMSTPRAYAIVDGYPSTEKRCTPKMMEALASGDIRAVANSLGNRFDDTMKLAQVRAIKKQLMKAGALGALMTGSGSAVYGIFTSREKAEAAAEAVSRRGEIFITAPCGSEKVREITL